MKVGNGRKVQVRRGEGVRMGSNGHQSGYEGNVKKWRGERVRERK